MNKSRKALFRQIKAARFFGAALALVALAACGEGSTPADPLPPPPSPPPSDPGSGESPLFKPGLVNLSKSEVERIVAQAAAEAGARSEPATIAVVDRVGNVLAVYRMNGAPATAKTREKAGGDTGLQGLDVPSSLAAIAKAITGAYLSSGGNAFSTRTASMIVQQHFPPSPATAGLESGPLFGVQISQLPCSDLTTHFSSGGPRIGPNNSPLGLAADPGGFPLYKNGFLVGGVGAVADGDYGFDENVLDTDTDAEELIALAGTSGFDAPAGIRADRIAVDGTTLRYADKTVADLMTVPANAPSFASINGVQGDLIDVAGYFDGGTTNDVYAGRAYGAENSGIRPAKTSEYSNGDIYVLSDGSGTNRYPPHAGTDSATVAQPLTKSEVQAILEEAFFIMTSARGQIRRPLGSRAEVSISVVDTNGQILGIIRGPDAPIFGTDVSLQKARTATFFSGAHAADDLLGTSPPVVPGANPTKSVSSFVADVRNFIPDPTALTGTVAFADRSGGNLSRPYFPDGEVGNPNGPLSLPISQWSPLNTGLQTSLVVENILLAAAGSPAPRCTYLPDIPTLAGVQNRLQNGIQIFPGSVPIYRGSTLIGGIGVSGDGVDQDDMISFLGVDRASARLNGAISNAPKGIRADNVVIMVGGEPVRLRFVNCPFDPFVDSDEQNVCEGK